MRYQVCGHVNVTVYIYVDADSEASAIEEAYDQLNTLDVYVGKGGTDQLVGVDLDEASVSCDDEITWNMVIQDENDGDGDNDDDEM